jgi:glycosyltransferase involved in cell wall biosynthesis
MDYDLSVVIPAFNESKTIGLVINRLLESLSPIQFELVVVDDFSRDSTAGIIRGLIEQHDNICLVQHESNKGKTEALKTGFKSCSGRVVLVQDADLEYDPKDILRVIQPILDFKADVVYGSRMLEMKKNTFMFKSLFANKVITFFSNCFTRYKFSDVETCYKAFRREIIQNMLITSQRFGFEIEVTAKLSKLRLRTAEVPISYNSRSYEEGKKIGANDGLQALLYILKYNLFTSLEESFSQIPDLSVK